MADKLLGDQLGIERALVARRRRERGIPVLDTRRRPWANEDIALLGTMADSALAERIGTTGHTVKRERERRNIPPFRAQWDDLVAARLGKVSDRKLASELGLDIKTVSRERAARGIPALRRRRYWTAEETALLGNLPDSEVARRLGINPSAARSERIRLGLDAAPSTAASVAWDEQGLGDEPDTVIAARLDLRTPTVAAARRERGIPAYRQIDWERVALGAKPDKALAAELGIGSSAVGRQRQQRGIPAFTGKAISQEGLPLRSVEEGLVDAWLHAQDVPHQHEVHVGIGQIRADFQVGDTYIEVIAMAGYAPYDQTLQRKRAAYAKAGIEVRWIDRAEARRLYMRQSPRPPLIFNPDHGERRTHCQQCGEPMVAEVETTRYCSNRCRGLSMTIIKWPALDGIVESVIQLGKTGAADRLGVKAGTLDGHLRRHATPEQKRLMAEALKRRATGPRDTTAPSTDALIAAIGGEGTGKRVLALGISVSRAYQVLLDSGRREVAWIRPRMPETPVSWGAVEFDDRSDKELALELGVRWTTVRAERYRRGQRSPRAADG